MNVYLFVKLVHILSASVLFGTGIGIAYFMLKAHLSGNREAFITVSKQVVMADWLFTTPAVIVQLGTGLWLAHFLKVSFSSVWFLAVMGLFLFVGICWLPVVWVQHRLSKMSADEIGGSYHNRLIRCWIALGIPAFFAMLAIFYLMVTKAGWV